MYSVSYPLQMYDGDLRFNIDLKKRGPDYFLDVEVTDQSTQRILGGGIVGLKNLCANSYDSLDFSSPQQEVKLDEFKLAAALQQGMGQAMADLTSKMIDWRKDSGGLYVPKVEAGDTIIVDKPGAPEIKVLDVSEQAFEKIPKKKMLVEEESCTCPVRLLCTRGCQCRGK